VYLQYNNENVINVFENFELLRSVNTNFRLYCKIRYVAWRIGYFSMWEWRMSLMPSKPTRGPHVASYDPEHKEFNLNFYIIVQWEG